MIRPYAITLAHAGGRITIQTAATCWQSALRAALNFEGAPVSAVLAIAEGEPIA